MWCYVISARYRRVGSKVGSSGKYELAGLRPSRFQNVGLQNLDPTRPDDPTILTRPERTSG